MNYFLFIVSFFLVTSARAQTLAEGYYGSTGKGHCKINIKKGNAYNQEITNCTYGFKTEGTYSFSGDTLILQPASIYNYFPAGKKKLVTDTVSSVVKMAKGFEKYLVKTDSLVQLHAAYGNYYKTWVLTKQLKK